MAELSEHVAYLSQEIGPRPAGTEEEQRAALYISETLSNQAGLPTSLEDFQCNPDNGLPKALCYGVAAVVGLLATIVAVLAVPAIVISALCAGLIAAEALGKPVLSRLMNKGVSQNVVAKYEPPRSTTRSSRRRKVIVVAHYDSGKIRRDLSSPVIGVLPIVYWAELAAVVLIPVLLLIRLLVSPEGAGLVVFNVMLAVALIVAVLPVATFVLEKLAEYNEAANCNASGVAVMMEVAARVAASRNLPVDEDPLIHGEQAAQSAGLVPEGAELIYEVAPSADADVDSSMESAAERLAAAKAAVAALSGKPVSATTNVVSHKEAPEETPAADVAEAPAEEAAAPSGENTAVVAAPAPAPAPAEPEVHEVPDWFKKGQEQAKRPAVEKPVQRSRYADALAAAEEEVQAREQEEAAAAEELSARLRTMRESVQAAAEAAGSHKTAVMPELSGEVVAAPASEAPAAAPAPSAPVSMAPETPMVPAVPAAPAVASAPAATESDLPAVPAVEPTDDPEVSLRAAARPLTGAADDSPLAHIPSPVDSVPAPAPKSERRLVVPAIGEEVAVPAVDPAAPRPAGRKRRAISLPNIGVSQELPRISMDDRGQAAPLSEERPNSDGRVHNLSAVVPSVSATPEPAAPASSRSASENALLDALPSLANAPAQADPGLSGSISLAGSFASMSATGAAAPLGDELIESTSFDELYIDDADDSAYEAQVTETGAMAGPGYVEMPKSRFGRLFGKFRHKEKEQVSTPQQWLDVEDDFEAREVGAARGGWESFREDGGEDLGQTTAFTPEFLDDAFDEDALDAPAPARRRGRPFEGGAYTPENPEDSGVFDEGVEPVGAFAEGLPADFVFEAQPEVEAIEQFHQKRVDVEVWFVALGSELAGNGGMKAFMEAHAADLKGSIIVELQGLGAGELTLIDKEGTYLAKKASSRMKRLVKKAGHAVGLSVPSATMEWMDNSAAYALKHGQQSMHLAGMAGKKPAFFAEADDVIENIDSDQLALNADFVMELLHHI